MGCKIRTKWLNQIQEKVKTTWIQPPNHVTSFPESKPMCTVQLQACGQVGALGHVQKEFEPVLLMSIDPGRRPQLVPMGPTSGDEALGLCDLQAAKPFYSPWLQVSYLDSPDTESSAAPFHLGRLSTWILGSWSDLSPVVWQWQASKLPNNCWRFFK